MQSIANKNTALIHSQVLAEFSSICEADSLVRRGFLLHQKIVLEMSPKCAPPKSSFK